MGVYWKTTCQSTSRWRTVHQRIQAPQDQAPKRNTPEAISLYIRTLRNPEAKLVYSSSGSRDDATVSTDLMVCIMKKDASVDVFDTLAKHMTRTDTLYERSELEAICEREDGWICVRRIARCRPRMGPTRVH